MNQFHIQYSTTDEREAANEATIIAAMARQT
jgi:hypothetical protein